MLKFLTTESQERFKFLQSRLASFEISEAEQHELNGLVTTAQKLSLERDTVLLRIKAEVAQYHIGALEVFSATDLRKITAGDTPPLAGAKKGKKSKATTPSTKKTGAVLIQVKLNKGAGAPSKYSKGQKFPAYVPKNFKLLDNGADLATNLAPYFTADGKGYFATPEGQAELAALVNYIRTGRLAPA